MEEKNIFEEFIACQNSCQAVTQREIAIEDYQSEIENLKQEIRQKEKIIIDYEIIKKNIEYIEKENIVEGFFAECEQYIEVNTPLFNYIRKRAAQFEQIKAIFLYSKEDIYDLWFIIEKNDFKTKSLVSKLFCDIIDIFDSILFDLMILSKDHRDLEELAQESYKTIYFKK